MISIQYSSMNQQSDWTAGPVTMITWDEFDTEVRHLPLLQAQKLHIRHVMSSFLLLPSPDLNLTNSKGLLMQFLPSVSELPLQPFPTEQYCSVYCLTAVHLVQILEDATSMPDGLEPTPEVLPFLMAVSRHLHMVDADPEVGAFKFHFLKSASLQPFVLQLVLDA